MKKDSSITECGCVAKLILKGKNNNQDLTKQIVHLVNTNSAERNFLMMDRLVLTREKRLYNHEYELVKKFKDLRLYRQLIPIRIVTFVHISNWLLDVVEGRNKNFGTKIKL